MALRLGNEFKASFNEETFPLLQLSLHLSSVMAFRDETTKSCSESDEHSNEMATIALDWKHVTRGADYGSKLCKCTDNIRDQYSVEVYKFRVCNESFSARNQLPQIMKG